MTCFRFHLIGPTQPVIMEVAVASIADLRTLMACQRFVEGRLSEPDGDGVLLDMLIATSRIECVIEVP